MATSSPPPTRAEFDALRALVERVVAENATLREKNAQLEARLAEREHELAELRTAYDVVVTKLDEREQELARLKKEKFGRTSERSGPKPRSKKPRPKNDAQAQKARQKNRDERNATLPTEEVTHSLEAEKRESCLACGHDQMRELEPDTSVEFEWCPGRLVRRVHRREKVMCPRCASFARAPAPPRVGDAGQYGPGFIARIIVTKLLDCVPHYRQSQMLAREGLPVARSTLVHLFHRGAAELTPLYERLCELVPKARVVHADETTLKMQKRKERGWVWTFLTSLVIVYIFKESRSGDAAVEILGDSPGELVVDAFTGYNKATVPERRRRAGCNSHARRKFVDAGGPRADEVIELYKEVFAVEREAKERGIFRTPQHLELRQTRAGPAMDLIKAWCDAELDQRHPKGGLGKAITYFRNQWKYLRRFVDDVEIDPTNNVSERALRKVALGRKNYLFVGHEGAGQNAAVLLSLAQTCVLHGVDPQQYLADVLIRIQSHPAARLDELLPHRWKDLYAPERAAG